MLRLIYVIHLLAKFLLEVLFVYFLYYLQSFQHPRVRFHDSYFHLFMCNFRELGSWIPGTFHSNTTVAHNCPITCNSKEIQMHVVKPKSPHAGSNVHGRKNYSWCICYSSVFYPSSERISKNAFQKYKVYFMQLHFLIFQKIEILKFDKVCFLDFNYILFKVSSKRRRIRKEKKGEINGLLSPVAEEIKEA